MSTAGAVLLRNRFEILSHLLETLLIFYIADDGQYGIIRCIVGPEKSGYVVDRSRGQIRKRTDDGMFVTEIRVCQIVKRLRRSPIGLIVYALLAFLGNRADLIIQIRLVDIERAHPVRFQEQSQIKLIRGQAFIVVRPVLIGRPVHVPAIVEDKQKVLAAPYVFRSP